MKISIFLTIFFSIQLSIGQCVQGPEFSKTTPKRDLRGVFLTTVFNLDWPSSRIATPAVQQAELLAILDNLKANGYNTVFLQVRSECDAMYNSVLEPWSFRLTGTQGLAPNPLWDPLSFAITEAHLRGLDLHAWLNPYRVKANVDAYTSASSSVLNTQPTWILTPSNVANLRYLNPGLPAVRNYITSIVQDLSNRYDLDGIHFDDYFYPDAGMVGNPDNATFTANNPTNIVSITDWRRNNVNIMITQVYDAIQAINTSANKNIVFGVSPAGIWKSGTPTGITGNPSFSALHCDPIAWLDAGKVDYLAPQLYWKITGPQDYNALSKWWNDQVKSRNKQIYMSQAYYKMTDGNNWAGAEIQSQIVLNRATQMDATFGQIAYRYIQIKNNDKTLNTLMNAAEYKFKSFAPPILGNGKDVLCANVPVNIRLDGLILKWDTPAAATDGDLPKKYVIYSFDSAAQAITNKDDGSKIIDIIAGNQLLVTQNQIDTKYFVVSSLDKNNNENGNFAQTLTANIFATDSTSLSIYPNPFINEFIISSKIAYLVSEVVLYDMSGKLVWSQKYSSTPDDIKVNPYALLSGLYVGKIINNDGSSQSFKIVKE